MRYTRNYTQDARYVLEKFQVRVLKKVGRFNSVKIHY